MSKKNKKKKIEILSKVQLPMWADIYINGNKTKYRISDYGSIWDIELNKHVPTYFNSDGYITVSLKYENKWHILSLHRLVAIAFIPNPLNKPEVNHIDGNKTHNNANNLEWVTHQENMIHANATGLRSHLHGIENPNNKYPVEQIRYACQLIANRWRLVDDAKESQLPISVVKNIAQGRQWREIANEFNVPFKARINIVDLKTNEAITLRRFIYELGLPNASLESYEIAITVDGKKYKVQRSMISRGLIYLARDQ